MEGATAVPAGQCRMVLRDQNLLKSQRFLCRHCHTCIAFWRGFMVLGRRSRKIYIENSSTSENLVVSYPPIIRASGCCKWAEMHCYECKSLMGLINIESEEPRSYFRREGSIVLFLEALKFWTGWQMREAVELTLPDNPF